ncbi:hypothetical protein KCU65_g476, partial [Aureobasidium melanogenum]
LSVELDASAELDATDDFAPMYRQHGCYGGFGFARIHRSGLLGIVENGAFDEGWASGCWVDGLAWNEGRASDHVAGSDFVSCRADSCLLVLGRCAIVVAVEEEATREGLEGGLLGHLGLHCPASNVATASCCDSLGQEREREDC